MAKGAFLTEIGGVNNGSWGAFMAMKAGPCTPLVPFRIARLGR